MALALQVFGLPQDLKPTAGPSFDHLHLTVATGTAPLVVASTTMVGNLNADLLDGQHAAAFLNATSLVLPFYTAAGVLDTIPLTADQKLPFFDSAAVAHNIALTT